MTVPLDEAVQSAVYTISLFTDDKVALRRALIRRASTLDGDDFARRCTDILTALSEAERVLLEIADSQTAGVLMSKRAYAKANQCHYAVKSLRALIEDTP